MDIIGLIEKRRIITDVKHTDHVETITSRNYSVTRDDRRFVTSQLGVEVVEGI